MIGARYKTISYLKEDSKMVKAVEKDLSRGRNNVISAEMFEKVDTQKGRQQVFELIDGFLSTTEIAQKLGKPINKISGRFTELKKNGIIRYVGKKPFLGSSFSVYEKVVKEL